MDGGQLVQWFSVAVSDGHDEVASLRKQLRHQQQAHREMQTMLKNQAFGDRNFPEQMASDWSKSTCLYRHKSFTVRGLCTS